jgi:hypothetical protein
MLMDHEYIEVKLNTNWFHQLFISASEFYHYEHKNFPLLLQYQVNLVSDMLEFLNKKAFSLFSFLKYSIHLDNQ